MAYPRYIGKSAFASGTGALTVAALTGTQAGDIIILFAESANQTINTPTGYSVLATQIGTGTAAAAGGVRIATFYRILEDAADTSTTVADSGDHTTAIKMLFRDTSLADGAFFVTATSTQAATTAMVFPAVTTATGESLVVLAVGQDTDAASTATVGTVTNANLANITERHDQTVTAGAGGGLAVITGEKATAGNTGTSTATGSTSVTHAYHTISLSRIAAQTTTSTFNTVAGTAYFPVSDALRITADSSGRVTGVASGTFQPNTLTNGTYALNFKWYYRQLGTDAWTASAAQASTLSALVSAGVLDTIGEFSDIEAVTGLTNGVEYEFVLFAARTSATPTNIISFSATATIAIPKIVVADPGTYSYTGTAANTLFKSKIVADSGTYSYTGTAANTLFNTKVVADSGTYSYTGTDANTLFNPKVVADAGTYSYTGTDANTLFNPKVVADSGTYSYTGTDATLTYTLLGAYTLVADAGTYSYTGTDANTSLNRKVVADPETYSYTGTSANTLFNSKVVADSGTYSYTGTNASLSNAYPITNQDSTFGTVSTTSFTAITDVLNVSTTASASLTFSGELTFQPQTLTNGVYAIELIWRYRTVGGSFVDVGTATTSSTPAEIDNGVLIITGEVSAAKVQGSLSANTNYQVQLYARRTVSSPTNTIEFSGTAQVDATGGVFSLAADSATYSYTGTAANTRYDRRMPADAGTYSYAGTDANALFNRKVVADAGAYAYAGTAANTLFNRKVVADAGTYSYAGTDANALFSRKVVADAGTYSYTGTAANTLLSRIMAANSGVYSYAGTNATLTYTPAGAYVIATDAGVYSYSGADATLTYTPAGAYVMPANAGVYSYAGTAATLTYTSTGFKVYFGTSQINKIYLGTDDISKIFLGTTGL